MIAVCVLVVFLTLSGADAVQDNMTEANLSVSDSDVLGDEGTYVDAPEAYRYLNEFRTEEGVWCWNEDDATKTTFNTNETNRLQPLETDPLLEQTARIRAKELAEYYGHERPDGTECWTVYPEGLYAYGENIAYGYADCKSVSEAWKEEANDYSGQAHRRVMLESSFNCVGIAGYQLNGVIYWVQAFAYSTDIRHPEAQTGIIKKLKTHFKAGKKTFKAKSKVKKYTVTLKAGETPVRKVQVSLKIGKKLYKTSTNKKGKATFKIKLKKRGKYMATVRFDGKDNYEKTKRKVAIRII